MAHRMPPRFLAQLGVQSVDVKFSSRPDVLSSVCVLTEEGNMVGAVFEAALPIPNENSVEDCVEEVKARFAMRKQLHLPFLPNIIDYDIWTDAAAVSAKVKVLVLFETVGKSLAERSCEGQPCTEPELQSWLTYSAKALSYMVRSQSCLLNIGPELIFANEGTVTFMDLDDVLTNPGWTMDLSSMRSGGSWRRDRWNASNILCPPLYLDPANFSKLQVYMWAMSFASMMIGEKFISETNAVLSEGPNQQRRFAEHVRRAKHQIKETNSTDTKRKLVLILVRCLAYFPTLCPSFEELDSQLFPQMENLSYASVKSLLDSRCGNCGQALKSPGSSRAAACSGLKVCEKCFAEAMCQMCAKPHALAHVDDTGKEGTRTGLKLHTCAISGCKVVYKIPTAGETMLGTAADCDIVLASSKVSSHHCRIRRGPDHVFYLRDLGSEQGTWVTAKGRIPLTEGMAIRLGEACCKVLNVAKDEKKFVLSVSHSTFFMTVTSSVCRIGSGEDNELVLKGADEHHAVTEFGESGATIHIVSNSGNTMIRLQPSLEHPIQDGDFVEIGDLRLRASFPRADREEIKSDVHGKCAVCGSAAGGVELLSCGHTSVCCRVCTRKLGMCQKCGRAISDVVE